MSPEYSVTAKSASLWRNLRKSPRGSAVIRKFGIGKSPRPKHGAPISLQICSINGLALIIIFGKPSHVNHASAKSTVVLYTSSKQIYVLSGVIWPLLTSAGNRPNVVTCYTTDWIGLDFISHQACLLTSTVHPSVCPLSKSWVPSSRKESMAIAGHPQGVQYEMHLQNGGCCHRYWIQFNAL